MKLNNNTLTSGSMMIFMMAFIMCMVLYILWYIYGSSGNDQFALCVYSCMMFCCVVCLIAFAVTVSNMNIKFN